MAPSFADIKSRASKAKDATALSLSNTKTRFQSHSSKNLDVMDPEYQKNKPPPPPPPARLPKSKFPPPPPSHNRPDAPAKTNSTASTTRSNIVSAAPPSAPPPPVSRTTRPDRDVPPAYSASPPSTPPRPPPTPARRVEPKSVESKIDWTNLSAEDKKAFFSWLDEFFSTYLGKTVGPSDSSPTRFLDSTKPLMQYGRTEESFTPTPAPPKIATWSKPSPKLSDDLAMTYPPPSVHGSTALDIAQFFHPSTHWDSAWYDTIPPTRPPPILDGDNWQMTGQGNGRTKELWYGIFCRDLSLCWATVEFPITGPSDPNRVKRDVCYLPRPKPMDRQSLIGAHETYGETIASFAESFVESRQYCARGECWDLASEGLKYFDQFDYVPKPVPSHSFTHGHLIVWLRVEQGKKAGKWFGGDDRVRRGDIVQWRSTQITQTVPGGRQTIVIGAPDHTSIVVSDCMPLGTPVDGGSFLPEQLGGLDVVEQSVSTGILPKRQRHEMQGIDSGEVWIYRPVGMKAYLGAEFTAKMPEGVNVLTL